MRKFIILFLLMSFVLGAWRYEDKEKEKYKFNVAESSYSIFDGWMVDLSSVFDPDRYSPYITICLQSKSEEFGHRPIVPIELFVSNLTDLLSLNGVYYFVMADGFEMDNMADSYRWPDRGYLIKRNERLYFLVLQYSDRKDIVMKLTSIY